MFIGEKKIARPFRWGIVGGGRTSGVGYKHRLGAMRDNTSFVLKAAAFDLDFARCVDIHRKPGYDPAEMFFDPTLSFPMFHAAAFLLKKKLGFRALMKIIPLNGDQVKGSHGRDRVPANQQPVFIGPASLPENRSAQDVHEAILSAFEKE